MALRSPHEVGNHGGVARLLANLLEDIDVIFWVDKLDVALQSCGRLANKTHENLTNAWFIYRCIAHPEFVILRVVPRLVAQGTEHRLRLLGRIFHVPAKMRPYDLIPMTNRNSLISVDGITQLRTLACLFLGHGQTTQKSKF
jgi:hypothetical protein